MAVDFSSVAMLADVNGKRSVLLQFRDEGAPRYPHYYGIPGGGREDGDKTPEETALREIREEFDINLEGRLNFWRHYTFEREDGRPYSENEYRQRCSSAEQFLLVKEKRGLEIYFSRAEHLYYAEIQPADVTVLREGRLADWIPVDEIVRNLRMLTTDGFMLRHFLTASNIYTGLIRNSKA